MTTPDTQLKVALAKMLPELVSYGELCGDYVFFWNDPKDLQTTGYRDVLDTELLHLCHLAEQTLQGENIANYQQWCAASFGYNLSIPWQQRVIALAKVKGIEI